MRLIHIPVSTTIALFSAILILYTITNPLDQAITAVKYPYTLSVKPSLASTSGAIAISLSYRTGVIESMLENITVLVVKPEGQIFEKTLNNPTPHSTLQFPNDFTNAEMSEGKYSVFLLANNINQNLTLNFEAVSYPSFIQGLFSFMTTDGQALTFGLLISLITVIYQFITTRYDETKKKREDKAGWMREKAKEYLKLKAHCSRICGYFTIAKNYAGEYVITFNGSEQGNEKRLLYAIVSFYKFYQDFSTNTSVYYFDDYYSENFVDEIIGKIYGMYDDIVRKNDALPIGAEEKQRDYLKKFFIDPTTQKDYDYYDLSGDVKFNQYARTFKNWLEEGHPEYSNANKFYAFHYI